MWNDETRKESDTCWGLISKVEYFNNNFRKDVDASVCKVFHKFMSAFC